MFKKRKIFVSTFLTLIIFTLHILNFNNLSTTNSLLQLNGENSSDVLIDNAQRIDVLANKSGEFFILSSDNVSTKISFLSKDCIESNQEVISKVIEFEYLDAKAIGNNIYLLVVKSENEKEIIKYSFSNNSFSSRPESYFVFSNSVISSFRAVDDTLVFIENNTLYGYIKNESSYPIELLSGVDSAFFNYSNDYLYVVKEDKSINSCSIEDLKAAVMEENNLNFTSLNLSDDVDLTNNAVNFLNENFIMSSIGELFKLIVNQNVPQEINRVLKLDISNIGIHNCSTISQIESKDYLFCKTSNNKITLFDIGDNFSKKYGINLNENSNIFNVCSSANNTLLVYKSSDDKYFAKLISEDDLLEETESEQNNSTDTQSPQNPSDNESDKLLGDYKTDSENKYILGVKLGTTIAEFKKNLNLNGEYTVSFKNYVGKEITSGKLGTGSVVTFWKDDHIFKEYTLVIEYDVTGEGNFNSRDLDYMYNEIFKNDKTSLSGEYFYSGDADGDGKIDTLDLLKMRKALS